MPHLTRSLVTMFGFVCCCQFAACGGSLYTVNDGEFGGIPFFQLQLMEKTVAVYQETHYEMHLELVWEAGTINKKNEFVREPKTENRQTSKRTTTRYADEGNAAILMAKFSASKSASDAYKQVRDAMVAVPPKGEEKVTLVPPEQVHYKEVAEGDRLTLVSLQRTRRAAPAPVPMYINVERPWSGTVGATVTLNANGTLTSAQASIEDKTLDTIIGAIPVADIISSRLGLADDDTEEESLFAEKRALLISATLTRIPIVTRYTISKEVVLDGAKPDYAIPAGATEGITISISVTRGSQKLQKEVSDEKAIEFSGKVKLPVDKKTAKKP